MTPFQEEAIRAVIESEKKLSAYIGNAADYTHEENAKLVGALMGDVILMSCAFGME